MQFILILAFFLSLSCDLFAKEVITIGVTPMVLSSSQGQLSEKVFTKIFNKLDYQLAIQTFPPTRLAERMKSGHIDGELIRMSMYADTRPYLIKVKEPHFQFTIAVYSANKETVISGWESIKNRHTAYRKGVKVVSEQLHRISKLSYLHPHTDIYQAMSMLHLKRIELYVGVEYLTDEVLKESHTEVTKNIHKISQLSKNTAHLFLNKKHAGLAEQISNELVQMKKNGEYKQILESIKNSESLHRD